MQVVHVRRDARSAQEIVTLCASPSSVQESAQEIPVVRTWKLWETAPFLAVYSIKFPIGAGLIRTNVDASDIHAFT